MGPTPQIEAPHCRRDARCWSNCPPCANGFHTVSSPQPSVGPWTSTLRRKYSLVVNLRKTAYRIAMNTRRLLATQSAQKTLLILSGAMNWLDSSCHCCGRWHLSHLWAEAAAPRLHVLESFSLRSPPGWRPASSAWPWWRSELHFSCSWSSLELTCGSSLVLLRCGPRWRARPAQRIWVIWKSAASWKVLQSRLDLAWPGRSSLERLGLLSRGSMMEAHLVGAAALSAPAPAAHFFGSPLSTWPGADCEGGERTLTH